MSVQNVRLGRRFLLAAVLTVGLAVSTVAGAQAAPEGPAGPSGEAGIQGGCDWTGCGMVVNGTSRGFHVTLSWGPPQTDIRWVGPWSGMGGGGVDVDGIYTGSGCVMTGVINGRIPGYSYPFYWTSGWHKIWTNETALVTSHTC